MGKLVPFDEPEAKTQPVDVGPPPDDAIAGASWLHRLLRLELWQLLQDPNLKESERRAEVLRFSRAITSSTPNHELYQIRRQLEADEKETEGKTLGGEVTPVAPSQSGPIRASAPRGKQRDTVH